MLRKLKKNLLNEERELESRKLNLIVFGLPEAVADVTEGERTGNDLLHINDILTHFKVETEVSSLIRLGKRGEGNSKARPLRF